MIKLRLKPQYEGLRITRNDIRVGKITFDANTVKEEHYKNYRDLGFDIFEEVEEGIEIEVIVPEEAVAPSKPTKEQKPTPEKRKTTRRAKK